MHSAAEHGANCRSKPGRRRTQCGHEIDLPDEHFICSTAAHLSALIAPVPAIHQETRREHLAGRK